MVLKVGLAIFLQRLNFATDIDTIMARIVRRSLASLKETMLFHVTRWSKFIINLLQLSNRQGSLLQQVQLLEISFMRTFDNQSIDLVNQILNFIHFLHIWLGQFSEICVDDNSHDKVINPLILHFFEIWIMLKLFEEINNGL